MAPHMRLDMLFPELLDPSDQVPLSHALENETGMSILLPAAPRLLTSEPGHTTDL